MAIKALDVRIIRSVYWGPNLVRNSRVMADCRMKLIWVRERRRMTHRKAQCHTQGDCTTNIDYTTRGIALGVMSFGSPVHLHYPMEMATFPSVQHTIIGNLIALIQS